MSYHQYRTCDGEHVEEVRLVSPSEIRDAAFLMEAGQVSFDLCRNCKDKLTVSQAETMLRERARWVTSP